jgi:hypothetical protein
MSHLNVRIPKPYECEILTFFKIYVGFYIFMPLNIKIAVFWDMTSRSLVNTNVTERYSASVFRVEE